jgi:tRNA(Ile)-lysidine synthase
MPSTRRPTSPERRLADFLGRHGIPPDARILAAFSGGSDSRALLELLADLAPPLELHAAYLDHGLRGRAERAAERAFVARVCAARGIRLHLGSVPEGSLRRQARAQGRSLEELARARRLRFLRRVARVEGCGYIALGHTADDQAETLVMRFFQGAGPQGLGGIPERRGRLIRPLLACGRGELQAWLAGRGLDYLTDSSNRDTAYLRNAVRLRLGPLLAELFPGYRGSLTSLARGMRELASFLEEESARRLHWRQSGQGYAVEAEEFFAAPALLRRLSLFPLLAGLGAGAGRLPARFLSGLAGRPGSRGVILAGRGVRLRRRGRELVLERDIVGQGKKGYVICIEPGRRYEVAGCIIEFIAGASGQKGAGVEPTPEKPPPVVRSATPADRIGTAGGGTAVSKLCSQWRIPLTERWSVPIVADGDGVLAVLGAGHGGRDRLRPGASSAGAVTVAVKRQPQRGRMCEQ